MRRSAVATKETKSDRTRAAILDAAFNFIWSRPFREMTVSDLIYRPRKTLLLREAEARGARVHGGLGMLLHQAALAFEKWMGRAAPVDVMRDALEEAMK